MFSPLAKSTFSGGWHRRRVFFQDINNLIPFLLTSSMSRKSATNIVQQLKEMSKV